MKYTKPPLSHNQKIDLLKARGLLIHNREKARYYLQHIWYFKLSWYFKFFQNWDSNDFVAWTKFKDVIKLYWFDRELRLLTLDAIEKIEVSLKASTSDFMSKKYGPFWYLDETLFSVSKKDNLDNCRHALKKIKSIQKRESAIFVKEYFTKYDEKFLPSWMLFEELSIWEFANIFMVIKSDDLKEISKVYDIYYVDLRKWVHFLVNIRNISAHHARLWNKKYVKKPRINDVVFKNKYMVKNGEVIPNYFNASLIINYMLNCIHDWFCFSKRLKNLFKKYKGYVDIEKMWFEKDWKKRMQ